MLVFIDTLADAVLLAIDPPLFCFREVAIILRHIFLFTILHAGLTLFEVGGLLRVQLATFNAIPNPLLLVRFALIHFIHTRMAGIDNSGASA